MLPIVSEDVRSLSLPGTYHEKIGCIGDSLRQFKRLKSLDLSRNDISSVSVSKKIFSVHIGKECVIKLISIFRYCHD